MRYLRGIIGGLIFGFFASIPWILLYVYGNFMIAYLAMPIAFGVEFGYKKFGGTVDKKLPVFITVFSLLIMILVNLLVIPIFLLYKEGYPANHHYLVLLYENGYLGNITLDLIISVIFTFIGISTVVNKAKDEVGVARRTTTINDFQKVMKENQKTIKLIFENKQAFDKYHTITKEDLEEVFNDLQLKRSFRNLRMQTIIKKKGNGYYYSLKAESSAFYRFITLYAKIMFLVILITALIIVIVGLQAK